MLVDIQPQRRFARVVIAAQVGDQTGFNARRDHLIGSFHKGVLSVTALIHQVHGEPRGGAHARNRRGLHEKHLTHAVVEERPIGAGHQ